MIKTKISNDLKSVMRKLNYSCKDNFTVEIPNNPDHGDYSSNIALLNSKPNKLKPRDLAVNMVEELKKLKDYENIDIAGPGFINFKVSPSVYHKELVRIYKAGDNFAKSEHGKGRKVLIEFISANPTGPLNIVSARAAAFGDTLYRVLKHIGYYPVREFYINDAGNQVDILAESLELRYRELHGEEIKEFPLEAYHGEYVVDLAQNLNSLEGSKLLHLSEKDRLQKMKEFALTEIHEMQVNSLEAFGVKIDSWISEKILRKQGIVEEVMSYLTEANVTYEKDDAIWFSSSKFGDEKDRVLMKSDGNYTYFVPDVGYHMTKYQRGFIEIIDVLGPDHHGYIPRLKAAMEALSYDAERLEVIFLQQVNLFDQGEKVKMSKRLGKLVTMDDLIEEVGKDAARFFFLDRKPSAHLNFDLELAMKKTNENPVFYSQYAHARICSILKNAKKAKVKITRSATKYLSKLIENDEITLIKKLLELHPILVSLVETREPHKLTAYVTELAGMFHKYYQKYRIVDNSDKELAEARLYLLVSIQNTLKVAFDLLGISAPEKM